MTVPFLACMALVASIYHLPPRVLPAIHGVEGGWPGAVNENSNGSQDLGVMQVNTRWIPALAHYTGQPEPFVRQQLLMHACYNIAASGLILRTYLDETHGDLMRAIGNYHSHTPPLNSAYQAQVMQSARSLFGAKPEEPALPPRRVTAAR